MNRPIVDVIIPVYNYADKVGEAIQSVKDQTVTNLKCYIVDDGSTDKTKDAVLEAIKDDERFEYIYKTNGGVATARNKGVFSGDGKYVCCLDADDRIAPRFLEVCVTALENDRTIDIAYTGLWYKKPDGEEGLSRWPDEYSYDEQLQGKNQLPTCNVARRKVWERLGGQRQRYAPHGAGEEDAEMWLRAGAYGFMAKKVSNEGLFLYSWMSGRVSGNKEHTMVDYRYFHPWVKDREHPFASVATPEIFSHKVRQYDEPIVSVIIPVGDGHNNFVIDALDSLEAQTFRKWEAIVVWDNGDQESYDFIKMAYPYVKLVKTYDDHSYGAGYARNRGAEVARAPFLVFLDADDQLLPEALEKMLIAYEYEEAVIYTDHLGKAFLDESEAKKLGDRLLQYDSKIGQAIFAHGWKDYNCHLAARQPNQKMYHWCLVTCLVPTAWHLEIGGYDEEMPSWEDWDYHIRLAKRGKCYVRVPDPLVIYRYYSGKRREDGLKDYPNLIEYMREKYEEIDIMPCNCGGKKKSVVLDRPAPQVDRSLDMADDNFVLVRYTHPNRGQHRVIGAATGRDYGYHAGGDMFLVHKRDIEVQKFFEVAETTAEKKTSADIYGHSPAPIEPKPLPEAEEELEIDDKRPFFDLQTIAGITSITEQMLHARGVYTPEDVIELGEDGLKEIKGIGDKRAESIIISAKKIVDEQ